MGLPDVGCLASSRALWKGRLLGGYRLSEKVFERLCTGVRDGMGSGCARSDTNVSFGARKTAKAGGRPAQEKSGDFGGSGRATGYPRAPLSVAPRRPVPATGQKRSAPRIRK